MTDKALFDDWPELYEAWFSTPIGRLVRRVEGRLILEMLDPGPGEMVLDAGCGTGIFTMDYLAAGAEVVGLDVSQPMLDVAVRKAEGQPFTAVRGDMRSLPFADESFDKTVSVTALEFVVDGQGALTELFRVTRLGGLVVVGTLSSLSPWATRRRARRRSAGRSISSGKLRFGPHPNCSRWRRSRVPRAPSSTSRRPTRSTWPRRSSARDRGEACRRGLSWPPAG